MFDRIEKNRVLRALASATTIAIAAAVFASGPARADTAQSPLPSQDAVSGDDSPLEPNTRVAQFFPFLFGQPQQPARPRYAPPPRSEDTTVHRRRIERSEDEEITPSSRVTRQSPTESLKERIVTMLRNPPAIAETKGPLLLTVSIAKQTVTLYDGGVQVAKGPVSTGTFERPTPLGVFSVLEKSWWHRSNMYSAAPMPFMQRITWSGVALHAGELPGYRASHGCVRLPDSLALRLWYTTRVGARVVIAWDELTPAEISHPLLFQPSPVPLPQPRPQPDQVIMSMNDASAIPSQDDPTDGADNRMTVVMQDVTHQDVPQDVVINDDDPELAHMMLAAGDDGAGATDEPTSVAEADDIALPLTPASLDVTDILRPKPPEGLFALARQKTTRRVVRTTAPEPEAETVLRPGPISVLISRKDRRIYVRKGLQPLFSMPVSIAGPEQPFGTHVYTVTAANDDGTQFTWTSVSPTSERRGRDALLRPTAAASAALDRITLPPSATDRIAPLLSVGATLIVTDTGLGRTANLLDSDFTVLLHPEVASNEEKPASSVKPERRRLAPAPEPAPSTFFPLFR